MSHVHLPKDIKCNNESSFGVGIHILIKMKVRTINPATEEILREYDILSEEHLLQMTKKAEEASKQNGDW